ncbi:hypothetical protein GCM10022222_22700 [Amycolatopsis ultiminotia]|uniref:GAF domain-containing protein n=1 Tax=Amycolatopsis ultiminotia TaxID=543629 RepID=A0ABP6VRN3_9PSEU
MPRPDRDLARRAVPDRRREGDAAFGEPYEAQNGTVVVPVSRRGRAIGLFTVDERGTTWTPAVDTGRLGLIGAATGFVAAALATLAVLRRPPWPELTERAVTAMAEARAAQARRGTRKQNHH